ncbi:hypothetical protein BD626DRAFT_606855 [Schizophyllum amplum]|uniref:Uncharacterized protein n=1 Tax=Schizophyllum amplum TaxID=97359 RepID=A0A550C4I9_9AGAR|nr:hypothetical protein BD626DRAFT_606855 [Auriculariopsis ampla]
MCAPMLLSTGPTSILRCPTTGRPPRGSSPETMNCWHVRGGWDVRGKYIAYEWRLCHLCAGAVEDAAHALFTCTGRVEQASRRHAFWDEVGGVDDTIRGLSPGPATWLRTLAANADTQVMLGKFAFNVLHLFSLHKAYTPPLQAWKLSSERLTFGRYTIIYMKCGRDLDATRLGRG